MIETQIRTYQTKEGYAPFREWLISLKDGRSRARIRSRIERLRVKNFGDYKAVGMGVFELRLHFGPGFRIYFAQHGNTVVLLLNGGDKSTQSKNIQQAQEYWMDYRRSLNETI